jgi:hypothetical protein
LTAFDFYSEVVKLYRGVPQNAALSDFTFEPYTKWIDESTAEVVDANRIIDNDKLVLKPATIANNYRDVLLTFTEDKDILNVLYTEQTGEIYGQARLNLDNEFGTDTLTIQSKFGANIPSFIPGTSIIAYRFLDRDGKGVAVKPRFAYYQGTSALQPIFLEDLFNIGVVITVNNVPQFGHYTTPFGGYAAPNKDFNFGSCPTFFTTEASPKDNLLNRFWLRPIREFYSKDALFVEGQVLLPFSRIKRLKFNEVFNFETARLAFWKITDLSIVDLDLAVGEFYVRRPFTNFDLAPYAAVNVVNNVVQFVDALDNTPVVTADPEKLEVSCEAYGFIYDPINNVCNYRPQILIQ